MESRYAGGSSGFIVDMWVCQGGLGCDGCIWAQPELDWEGGRWDDFAFSKFPLAFAHQYSSFSIKKRSKNSYVNLLIPHVPGLRVKAACKALKPGKFKIYTGVHIAELISITYLDARKVCLFCPGSFVASGVLREYMY